MNAVEALISELPTALNAQFSLVEKDGDIYPVSKLGLVCSFKCVRLCEKSAT